MINGIPSFVPYVDSPLSKGHWDAANLKFFKSSFDFATKGTGSSRESEVVEFKKHVEEKKGTANQISAWLDESIGKKPRYCISLYTVDWNNDAFLLICRHHYGLDFVLRLDTIRDFGCSMVLLYDFEQDEKS